MELIYGFQGILGKQSKAEILALQWSIIWSQCNKVPDAYHKEKMTLYHNMPSTGWQGDEVEVLNLKLLKLHSKHDRGMM